MIMLFWHPWSMTADCETHATWFAVQSLLLSTSVLLGSCWMINHLYFWYGPPTSITVCFLFCISSNINYRHYFGEKVAIYFSWLGFYTLMLVPASIVGFAVFIYGLATLGQDQTSKDICGDVGADTIMCPQCDERCSYWRLNESCTYSRVGLWAKHVLTSRVGSTFIKVAVGLDSHSFYCGVKIGTTASGFGLKCT